MGARRNIASAFAIRLSLLLVASLMMAGIAYGDSPTVDQVISNAKAAFNPTIAYQVSVTQHIENAKGFANTSASVDLVESFYYTPIDGLQRAPGKRTSATSNVPRVTIDIPYFFDMLEASTTKTLSREGIDGDPHYSITATTANAEQGFVLWVDSATYAVRRIHYSIEGALYAIIDVESSQQDSSYWLPERIKLFHTTDSSTVTFDYSAYTFQK